MLCLQDIVTSSRHFKVGYVLCIFRACVVSHTGSQIVGCVVVILSRVNSWLLVQFWVVLDYPVCYQGGHNLARNLCVLASIRQIILAHICFSLVIILSSTIIWESRALYFTQTLLFLDPFHTLQNLESLILDVVLLSVKSRDVRNTISEV